MKMQYLESLQAFVTTEIRIWDPSQPPIIESLVSVTEEEGDFDRKHPNLHVLV